MIHKSTFISLILLFIVILITPITNASESATDSSKTNLSERIKAKMIENQEELKLKIQEKREEFKEKLQKIKDERKQEIAERTDEELAKVNQNSTARMSLAIGKLEVLLDKFATRAATQKTEGKDTAEVDTAIVVAKDAITDAKDAVATQAAKEYTADLSDETNLKNSFGQTMSELREDLKATHDIVKLAKQKVMDVARALAKLRMPTPTL